MANKKHVEILKQGVEVWNEWRWNLRVKPDFTGADLSGVNLSGVDISEADFYAADLSGANLSNAYLNRANLSGADLSTANLYNANLSETNLSGVYLYGANLLKTNLIGAQIIRANLSSANLYGANLSGVDLSGAYLSKSNFSGANLSKADLTGADISGATFDRTDFYYSCFANVKLRGIDFSRSIFQQTLFIDTDFYHAILAGTVFAACDLSQAKNLHLCIHRYPSSIDTQTLSKSGDLPVAFLRGCAISDNMIAYLPGFKQSAIEYHSCFLSHSTLDDEFVKKLYLNLTGSDVRCWYAPEDMKAGRKLHDQINEAIHVHDKLLLVLSENSINSDWVATEIKRARKREKEEGRTLFFPISLIPYEKLKKWELYDGGANLADEIRDYYIPDFSNWRDEKKYKEEFDKLRESLRTGKREK